MSAEMNEQNTPGQVGPNPSQSDQDFCDSILPTSSYDLLISRVIDGRASAEDWDRFRAIAADEPTIWVELAETQTQSQHVRDELSSLISIADRVSLPGGTIDDSSMRHRMQVVSKWGGWATAAAILLFWFFGMPATSANPTTPIQQGGIVSGLIPLRDAQSDQAFDQYLSAGQQSGRVIAEMPEQVVIETRPMPNGTIEVLYLRQVIERRVIDQAYRQVLDETGNRFEVPIRIEPISRGAY